MSSDKDIPTSDGKEIINPDGSSISEIEPENHEPKEIEGYHISKDTIPSFKKILVTDDGKDISNKALNYAVSLSNSTGAELHILRILKDVEKFGDVSLEGSHEMSQMDNQDYHRKIKGEIIDAMEEKIKKCQEAGCKNKVSYKFLTGNVVDEIVNEIDNNNYDLVVMLTSHIDSWFSSLFSDVRKIISSISKPVLIIQ
ncbi:MAG TPA: universal stress protein [Nitrososphaeraceae archaeon]|jgi:nucleotide-binding universal stress UspA family protein|nr:Universal stress protein family protein [Nitrososphaeraceae archaeon]